MTNAETETDRRAKKEKPTLLQAEQPVCALLIWIPHEKVQVTESLLKQPSERDLFGVFSSKLEGKKKQETNRVFGMLYAKGVSVTLQNDRLYKCLWRPH